MDPMDPLMLPLETTSMEDLVAFAQAKGIRIEVTKLRCTGVFMDIAQALRRQVFGNLDLLFHLERF